MSDAQNVRAELRNFLITRRAKLSPSDVGLAPGGSRRRVKGLRREEVALLAGISAEYYVRLERGHAAGASPSVVNSIARALKLGSVEKQHLTRLLLAVGPGVRRATARSAATARVRPNVQNLLDALRTPAFVFTPTLDILATNEIGFVLYTPLFEDAERPVNLARSLFLAEDEARAFWLDWDVFAQELVALLHAEISRRPQDDELVELVDELSTSASFQRLWAANDVLDHSSGVRKILHPAIGELTLPYENVRLATDPDLLIVIYVPQPDTTSAERLQRLRSESTPLVSGIPAKPS